MEKNWDLTLASNSYLRVWSQNSIIERTQALPQWNWIYDENETTYDQVFLQSTDPVKNVRSQVMLY